MAGRSAATAKVEWRAEIYNEAGDLVQAGKWRCSRLAVETDWLSYGEMVGQYGLPHEVRISERDAR